MKIKVKNTSSRVAAIINIKTQVNLYLNPGEDITIDLCSTKDLLFYKESYKAFGIVAYPVEEKKPVKLLEETPVESLEEPADKPLEETHVKKNNRKKVVL